MIRLHGIFFFRFGFLSIGDADSIVAYTKSDFFFHFIGQNSIQMEASAA